MGPPGSCNACTQDSPTLGYCYPHSPPSRPVDCIIALLRHSEDCAAARLPHECPKCGSRFPTKRYLTRHVQRPHGVCEVCGAVVLMTGMPETHVCEDGRVRERPTLRILCPTGRPVPEVQKGNTTTSGAGPTKAIPITKSATHSQSSTSTTSKLCSTGDISPLDLSWTSGESQSSLPDESPDFWESVGHLDLSEEIEPWIEVKFP